MEILYFIPGRLSLGPLGSDELPRRRAFLERHAGPGVSVEVLDSERGPSSIESVAEEELAVPTILEAVASEGPRFDALIIGCFGDPGLEAAREIALLPVVAPGQASLHLALQLGEAPGILAVVDQVVPANRRRARSYGLERFVAGIESVDVPVLELAERKEEVLPRLVEKGLTLLERGADTIVLGCMSMGFLDVTDQLGEQLDVPVINPVLAALKSAEVLSSLDLHPSRRCYPSPRKQIDLGAARTRTAPAAQRID